MAYRKRYAATAVIGLALVSAAGWWLLNRPSQAQSPGAAPAGGAAAGASASAPAAAGVRGAGPGGPGGAGGPGGPGGAGRPVAVEVAKVAAMTLVDETQATGTLRSRQGVMLRPEVAGRVKQILFEDGQRVRKGQLLVQLEDQLQQAQLAQSRAELSIAQANHQRNQELVAQNFVSQRSADETAAALEVARARLALAEATLQRLRIVAPFDGVAGLRMVNVGDYLKDGADIVNIEDLDALLVDFRLPERFQSRVRAGQSAQLSADALPGRPLSALIQAIDPLIDANARSVGVRGCIDNRSRQLRPGMFVRVNAVFGQRENALVVPEEAIVPQGGRAFVVKVVPGEQPGQSVSQRVPVRTGLRLPGRVEILEGLQAGDSVVVAGQQRLQRDGLPVRVVDMSRGGGAGGAAGGAGGPARPASEAASAAGGASTGSSAAPAGAMPRGEGPGARLAAGVPGQGGAPVRVPAPTGPNPCLRG